MTAPAGDRLETWKEIAAYLRRGVRTVRRWEREEGLPVHRHVHRVLGTVFAFRGELDAWRLGRGGGAARPRRARAAVEPVPSIAVLPFIDLGGESDEYFADGLTDEVTSELSGLRSLRVISRTSAMTLKGTRKDLQTVARELGVRYLLEGTLRRAGERLRVTARLIDAATDSHLWSEKYDGTTGEVFAIQERLARLIVEALQLRLSSEEERALGARPIPDLRAWECYLRARQEGWRWRADAIDRAVQLLRQGLEIVGDNATLHAALGSAHLQYREAGIDLSDAPLLAAEECVRKVFELAPGSAAGLRLRGAIHYARADVQQAVVALGAALALDPGNADTLLLLSNCYLISGRVAAARPLIARALAVDPLTPITRCMPGFADILEGNFAAAVEPYRKMLEMDPGNPMARLFLLWVLAQNGEVEELAALVDGFPAEMRSTVPARLASFLAFALRGDPAGAAAAVTHEVEVAAGESDVFARMLAQGYAVSGLPEPAMRWLATAVARGFVNHPFLARHDPLLESLRPRPDFQLLLETVRGRWERFVT